VIDPKAVGEIEFSITSAEFSDGGEVAAIGVIAVDAVAAVSIREVDAAITGVESGVGGHESVPPPFGFVTPVFSLGVESGGHGSALIPNCFSGEGEFRE